MQRKAGGMRLLSDDDSESQNRQQSSSSDCQNRQQHSIVPLAHVGDSIVTLAQPRCSPALEPDQAQRQGSPATQWPANSWPTGWGALAGLISLPLVL